jgi:hypothetical protein
MISASNLSPIWEEKTKLALEWFLRVVACLQKRNFVVQFLLRTYTQTRTYISRILILRFSFSLFKFIFEAVYEFGYIMTLKVCIYKYVHVQN